MQKLTILAAVGLIITVFASLTPRLAEAETHLVQMLNADPNDPNTINLFEPAVLRVEPGDTVKFLAVDRSHNSASKKGMIPAGAEPWNGKIDEEIEITFDVEGTYGYICLPHYAMGMVGLILVGDYTGNLEAARKVRHVGKARQAFRDLFAQIDATQ
ncbi:MAG: pseudoazurin [Pseudomonadota bacterium]